MQEDSCHPLVTLPFLSSSMEEKGSRLCGICCLSPSKLKLKKNNKRMPNKDRRKSVLVTSNCQHRNDIFRDTLEVTRHTKIIYINRHVCNFRTFILFNLRTPRSEFSRMIQVQMMPDICSTAFVGVMNGNAVNDNVSNQTTKWKEDNVRHLDQNTIDYFKNLIRKYKKKMGDSENNEVCSGGLQQYLNKIHEKDVRVPESKNPQRVIEGQCRFYDIPVALKLHIFSYLQARDLCQVSCVCKEWYELTQDNLLWQQLLKKDVRRWNVIGHNTYPGLYKEVQSEWTNKDIYLRCSPEVTELMIQRNAVFHNISSLFRYFLPKKVPMLAMFGPGLESSTSCIVRRMMYEENNCFQKIGLFPGMFDGVGAGMTVRVSNTRRDLNLSVLYSATKKEREGSRQDRMKNNKLVRHNAQEEEGKEKFNLLPAVRDLCRTLDGFVFVVDASQETVSSGSDELEAMISERWSATHVPVLVLSCVREEKDSRIPCIQVVEQLKLAQLNRPWQVRNCVADTLTGVPEALTWLLEQSQRR